MAPSSPERNRHAVADSNMMFRDATFREDNKHISDTWVSIREIYPDGMNQPLLPNTLSRDQFAQGMHYECFMLSALAALMQTPYLIRHCFVTQEVRNDGRYVFQFFRDKSWVEVEIDDTIALEDGEILYMRSPTEHWWPLLLEKAYAKFYTAYDHLEGCTLQETFHDLTGNPVLNIPVADSFSHSSAFHISEGPYWLDLAQKLQTGEVVASALTNESGLEKVGLQVSQQYAILHVFSLTGGSSVSDVVIQLYNPFEEEEYAYTGPLNPRDSAWQDRQRERLHVEDERLVFMPLAVFLRVFCSIQICATTGFEKEITFFEGEWRGETAGGNPTCATWRKNPLFLIQNTSREPLPLMFVLKQEDQRHLQREPSYHQTGLVLAQLMHFGSAKIPTFFVTGNNHRIIAKSLFINSRENASAVVVPPQSLCYLGPCCLHQQAEARFTLSMYKTRHQKYHGLTVEPLRIPGMTWDEPQEERVELMMRTKDRLDFFVEEPTDVHILMRQTLPFVSPKTGGDAIAQDYLGLYLYDDTDKRIAAVHAATNFRETSIVEHLPRSGRYAISVTCPRSKGEVPAMVTLVANKASRIQMVDPPENASVLPEEQETVEEGDTRQTTLLESTVIDWDPQEVPSYTALSEPKDGALPYEDKRFYTDNRVTEHAWVHIGDLYPEGKILPLLPEKLSRSQFAPGTRRECSVLSAFAALVDHHDDVIRRCFVSKHVRRDGGYTFQFYRYGEWVKVEVDDRIPMDGNETIFCNSPTHHWWPLLLEKAYAKFYTLYQNLEGLTLQESFHDFTGCCVMYLPVEGTSQSAAMQTLPFWLDLADSMEDGKIALGATCGSTRPNGSFGNVEDVEAVGLKNNACYAILDVTCVSHCPSSLSDIMVTVYNAFPESPYTGPSMQPKGGARIKAEPSVFYISATDFLMFFASVEKAKIADLSALEGWNFRSEWGEGTNGGNPNQPTWCDNPVYVVQNNSKKAVTLTTMIRQPDQRHLFHSETVDTTPQYVDCSTVLCQNISGNLIPTYLITRNTHRILNENVFLNQREVCEDLLVPPESLCYLVPCGTHNEMSRFQLSGWWKPSEGEDPNGSIHVSRLRITDVDRRLPAVSHLTLTSENKRARVDFEVASETNAHILVTQLKPSSDRCEGLRTDEFLGIYLYDSASNHIYTPPSATNYRRAGIVVHLPNPGAYVLSIVYADGKAASVPCKVEIVCSRAAHVRLLENPEEEDPSSAHSSLPDEPDLTPTQTARSHDHNRDPLAAEEMEEQSTIAAKETGAEDEGRRGSAASDTSLLSFLEEEYLGIPTRDIPLSLNAQVSQYLREMDDLKANPTSNATAINELSCLIESIAKELANCMHEEERSYLPREPNGVPLDLLPLNEDPEFSELEDELRRVLHLDPVDIMRARECEAQLERRASTLANELKNRERELFLDPMPAGVRASSLPLDSDEPFHTAEVHRLRIRVLGEEDSETDEEKVRELNVELNHRAEELALRQLRNDRSYLHPEYLCIPIQELPLDENKQFLELESRRHELLHAPSRPKADEVAQIHDELHALAHRTAAQLLDQWRPVYLQAEYRGWYWKDLPLNECQPLLELEKKRRALVRSKEMQFVSQLPETESAIHAEVEKLAEAKSAAERARYLHELYHGVPVQELAVDQDEDMRELEIQRAQLMREPARNSHDIRHLVDAMHERAEDLAVQRIQEDQRFLERFPHGVPLELLPYKDDDRVQRLMMDRVDVLGYDVPEKANAPRLAQVEAEIRQRIRDLADERKSTDRTAILSPVFCENIEHHELALDADNEFVEAEAERYLIVLEQQGDEDEAGTAVPPLTAEEMEEVHQLKVAQREKEQLMQERYKQLAKKERQRRRRQVIGSAELYGVPIEDLPLDTDEAFSSLEGQRDKWLGQRGGSPSPESAPGKDRRERLEKRMKNRAKELAIVELFKRHPGLNPMPSGVPVGDLDPLADKMFFADWEPYQRLLRRGHATIGDWVTEKEALEHPLNVRLLVLAKNRKLADRDVFFPLESTTVDPAFIWFHTDTEFRALEDRYVSIAEAAKGSSSKDWGEKMEAASTVSGAAIAAKTRLNIVCAEWVEQQRAFITQAKPEWNLIDLALDEDSTFRTMEDERLSLKEQYPIEPHLHAIKEVERNILQYLMQREQPPPPPPPPPPRVEEDLSFLDNFPEGIPLRCVDFSQDPQFITLQEERAGLRQDQRLLDIPRIKILETEMNARVHELALSLRKTVREQLDQVPEGVPLILVPLDSDEKYSGLEVEQIVAKHDGEPLFKSNDRLGQLNARSHELAREERLRQRAFLDQEPEGIPLEEIALEEDEEFVNWEDERLLLLVEKAEESAVEEAGNRMQARVYELARSLKKTPPFDESLLNDGYEGMRTSDLVVLKTPELEEKWRELCLLFPKAELGGSKKDENQRAELKGALDSYLTRAARHQLARERASYLPRPVMHGVPISLLPLNSDPRLQHHEHVLRHCEDADALCEQKVVTRDEVRRLAMQFLWSRRANYLDSFPEGIPLTQVGMDEDAPYLAMEEEHFARVAQLVTKEEVKNKEVGSRSGSHSDGEGVDWDRYVVREDEACLEAAKNDVMAYGENEMEALPAYEEFVAQARRRVSHLAKGKLERERESFIAPELAGLPLSALQHPLTLDKPFRLLEVSRFLRVHELLAETDGAPPVSEDMEPLGELERRANQRAVAVAKRVKLRHRTYLQAYAKEVPLEILPLDTDDDFHHLELHWYELKAEELRTASSSILAAEEQEEEGAQQQGLECDSVPMWRRGSTGTDMTSTTLNDMDSNLEKKVETMPMEAEDAGHQTEEMLKLRRLMGLRVEDLAQQWREMQGWEDTEFHEKNKDVAPYWPRLHEVYPDGAEQPVLPDYPSTAHFVSQPDDVSYIAPFLACLTRTPALLERLYFPRERSSRDPFTFVFFDPSGRPVPVDVDDRIPCDENYRPMFTASPTQSWWPLLLEKAYAKFVGGYLRMENCTVSETLRDLTGRPVTHIPLETKYARELDACDFTSLDFWRGVHQDLEKGDGFVALSREMPPDGLHSSCFYTIFDVIESVPGSENVEDVLIKVHNCFPDGSVYRGASMSSRGAPQPPGSAKRKGHQEFLSIPYATFIRNFCSVEHCHVNCGDRLTIAGEWNEANCGGNPKYTTFKNNSMYVVENHSDTAVTCLAEIRHMSPVFYDPNNVGIYHHTALSVWRSRDPVAPISPLFSYTSHELVCKGLLTDARDVTVYVTLPPKSVSYLVPYTKKKGCYGRYQVSIYPGDYPIELSRLRPMEETHHCFSSPVVLQPAGSTSGAEAHKVQVDFAISDPCDVHVLLHQEKVTDSQSIRGGDYLAEDEVTMTVYRDLAGSRLTSTGDATNARDHAMAFTAKERGRYTLFITSPSWPKTGECPCTLTVFVPQSVRCKFVPPKDLHRHARHKPRAPPLPRAQNPHNSSQNAKEDMHSDPRLLSTPNPTNQRGVQRPASAMISVRKRYVKHRTQEIEKMKRGESGGGGSQLSVHGGMAPAPSSL